jgi:hypothetical protein
MARPAKLERLRRRAMNARTKTMRAYWKRSLDRNRRKYLSQTVSFDGVPTMRGLALLLGHVRKHHLWVGGLNSSDRRVGVAERYGHSSQAALYAGWVARRPGYLPANPPGFSSHELRSDGAPVYHTPRGAVIPWHMLGLDVSDDRGALDALQSLGVHVTHPYSSRSEAHHLNVLGDPTDVLVGLGYV